jgi:hypothetical protein
MAGARAGAKLTLIAAICCAVLSLAKLAAADIGAHATADAVTGLPVDMLLLSAPERLWRQAVSLVQTVPSPQLLIVAVLGLEALHPRRPWHTAVLGLVLLGFLVALHVTESDGWLAVFGAQLPLVAAGVALAVLSVAAAALPPSASGSGSGWLAVLAGVAAIVAAGLALPV